MKKSCLVFAALSCLVLSMSGGARAAGSSPFVVVTNGSIALTTGGTAQTVFTANPNRTGGWCYNPHATISVWISATGTAVVGADVANSGEIRPGGYFGFSQGGHTIQSAISVNASDTGHVINCVETQ